MRKDFVKRQQKSLQFAKNAAGKAAMVDVQCVGLGFFLPPIYCNFEEIPLSSLIQTLGYPFHTFAT